MEIKYRYQWYQHIYESIPQILEEARRYGDELGAKKQRLVVKLAGGASTHGDPDQDYFQVGKRNLVMLRKLLWKNGVIVQAEDVGASHARTMSLVVGTGRVMIKANGNSSELA